MPDDDVRKRVQRHVLASPPPAFGISVPPTTPLPATPPRRDSLRHIKFKVSKSWLAGAAWAAIVSLVGWVITSVPLMLSWEKHQVTDGQMAHVLNGPGHAAFDELLLPTQGVLDRLKALEETSTKLQVSLTAESNKAAELSALLFDEYRWRARWQAADAEHDPRKRMDSANRAEAKFKRAVADGKPLAEAFRYALETNPYDR